MSAAGYIGYSNNLDNQSHGSVSKTYYAYSPDYVKHCNVFEKEKGRALAVHSLINAYKLFNKLRIYKPRKANRNELVDFHTREYVTFVQQSSSSNNVDPETMEVDGTEFGFGYDCPVERGLFDYIQMVVGATIDAARALSMSSCRVAINWGGGWHHAKQTHAAGFCYVNDCVLGIMKLREKFQRVLYLDIDVHHGDGVEDAFCATDKVLTLSLHHSELGYFPGTGADMKNTGFGKGKYHSLNVPLKEGLTDDQLIFVFEKIAPEVFERFQPKAVMLQCGADGLSGDPIGVWNLTPKSFCHIVKNVLSWDLPTLIIGGGGYSKANVARCWAEVTAAVLGTALDDDIPEHQLFSLYSPGYSLHMNPGKRKNCNTQGLLDTVTQEALESIRKIPDKGQNCDSNSIQPSTGKETNLT